MKATKCPTFAASETTAVIEYANSELWNLGSRLGLDAGQNRILHDLFMDALQVNAVRMTECLEQPFVEAIPESRALFTLLEKLMIENVETAGLENLAEAIRFMQMGGNVLLVSNHTSGADTLVLDCVANAMFPDTTRDWIYMAGHVVNYFLLPLAVTGGVNRVQIFSAKYCAQAGQEVVQRMRENNARALMSIGPRIMAGGRCVVLYPEGGRGNGALLEGEPRTMKIPQLMEMVSPKGLMVLPSYVEATGILPVARGENEFNEFLSRGQRGRATLKFGPGMMWRELQPTKTEIQRYLTNNVHRCSGDPSFALKQWLLLRIMRMIANLAPPEARGPYTEITP